MGNRVREGQGRQTSLVEAGERDLLGSDDGFLPIWSPRKTRLQEKPECAADAQTLPGRISAALSTFSPRLTVSHALAALETELDRGAAFLLAPVFLAIGALAYFGLREEPAIWPLLLGAALLAAVAFAMRGRRWWHLALMAALLAVSGAVAAKVETMRHNTRMLGAEISTTLTGRIVEVDHLASGRVRLTMQLVATERPTLRYAPEHVRLTARKLPAGLAAGDVVSGYVRLMPPSGPVRPGSYDFSFESYFDGIGASGFFMRGPVLVTPAAPVHVGDRLDAWIENARDSVARRIRERVGGAEGEIAAALVVGVRGGIPEEVNEALRRTGLYHIISISGLHMAIVAGTVMLSLRLAFALFPGFASRHPVKKYAAFSALVATGGYLFFSGAEVAAQRSFIMLAVMLTAVLFDRAALTMRNLAISAVIVIVLSPHEVVGPSFQMSFAATAALVGAYGWWAERPVAPRAEPRSVASSVSRRLLALVIGLVVTSLIAGLATSIYSAWHFQRVSPLSLLANLAVMPIVSILVMPFAVAAGLLMPLGLEGLFLDTMALGLSAMLAIAGWFSERSPIDAVGLISTHAVVFATIALVMASISSTWLRMAAIPFMALALLTLTSVDTPDVLVSEDARVVGALGQDNGLAVNRGRASSFVTDNWQRALAADGLVKPLRNDGHGQAGAAARGDTESFRCGDGLCQLTQVSGAVIAHAIDGANAEPACAVARIIVVEDATASDVCPDNAAVVITGRDLARSGSVAIYFADADATAIAGESAIETSKLVYAIPKPYRPWHAHRAFSREARGIAPYKRANGTLPAPGAE